MEEGVTRKEKKSLSPKKGVWKPILESAGGWKRATAGLPP
jgi:hypothetical protein